MRRPSDVVLVPLALALVALPCAACSAILGLEPPPGGDGPEEAGVDATTNDSPVVDSAPQHDGGADAAGDVVVCVALDAGGDGSTTYFPFASTVVDEAGAHNWQYFEPSSVDTDARNFQGGVFDGRYVYFAPNGSGTVTRYDTHGSFVALASWTTFDTTALAPTAEGYNGAIYDGRYVYFVPYRAGASYGGLLVRYDTSLSFATTAAWSTFDMGALPVPEGGTPLTGFGGGVYDGRVVYFAPYFDGVDRLSRVVRYDPDAGPPAPPTDAGDAGAHDASDGGDGGPRDAGDGGDAGGGGDAGSGDASGDAAAGPPSFASASQFSTFDVSTRNASAAGFVGALFDGRYVYAIPYVNNAGTSGVLARYDTDASFTSGGAWTVFDTTTVNAQAYGFTGAAFDGRFVYLVPHARTIVARYDTQAGPVNSKAAWSTYDIATVVPPDSGAPSFSGGAFDGRFVYFVPGTSAQGQGMVVRYDTWSTFGAPCAWSVHDVSQDVAGATSYYGAVYDGQYLYLVPKGTWVARFDTKTPGSMPALPAFNGSFY